MLASKTCRWNNPFCKGHAGETWNPFCKGHAGEAWNPFFKGHGGETIPFAKDLCFAIPVARVWLLFSQKGINCSCKGFPGALGLILPPLVLLISCGHWKDSQSFCRTVLQNIRRIIKHCHDAMGLADGAFCLWPNPELCGPEFPDPVPPWVGLQVWFDLSWGSNRSNSSLHSLHQAAWAGPPHRKQWFHDSPLFPGCCGNPPWPFSSLLQGYHCHLAPPYC